MEINEYKEWIMSQISVDEPIEPEVPDDDHINLVTKWAVGQIAFYDQKIIELSVRQGEENRFYLHFQLNDEEHAMGLFMEMKDTLLNLKDKEKYKVLLTCSSALTTSFFAQSLNNTAQMLKENMEFHAVSIDRIFAAAIDYDMVLIAPQEAFEYNRIRKVLTDKIILKIPTAMFAGYQALELIGFINEERNKAAAPKQEEYTFDIHTAFDNQYRILTMGMINHKDIYRFGYRIYDHGRPTLDKEVIKQKFSQDDMYDLLDYIVARHKDIDAISIALPGVTFHGHLYHPTYGFMNENLGRELSERYNIPTILINDVNAVALGYHVMHDNTDNMVFYFQPVGFSAAGAGVIINGKLVTGRYHAAGEMKYDIGPMFPDGDKMCETTEGTLEVLCAGLRSYIATIAPEKIVINCMMVPDADKVREKLLEYLPEEYIPELEHVYHFKKYMLPGAMIHALQVIFDMPDWTRSYSVKE